MKTRLHRWLSWSGLVKLLRIKLNTGTQLRAESKVALPKAGAALLSSAWARPRARARAAQLEHEPDLRMEGNRNANFNVWETIGIGKRDHFVLKIPIPHLLLHFSRDGSSFDHFWTRSGTETLLKNRHSQARAIFQRVFCSTPCSKMLSAHPSRLKYSSTWETIISWQVLKVWLTKFTAGPDSIFVEIE